jgi:hypothetical protein
VWQCFFKARSKWDRIPPLPPERRLRPGTSWKHPETRPIGDDRSDHIERDAGLANPAFFIKSRCLFSILSRIRHYFVLFSINYPPQPKHFPPVSRIAGDKKMRLALIVVWCLICSYQGEIAAK